LNYYAIAEYSFLCCHRWRKWHSVKEVAEELLIGFENNQFDVPVGQTKVVHVPLQKKVLPA